MESRLPKPTSMIKKTVMQRVPIDRMNSSNAASRFLAQNRQPISMDIENVRNALNVPHGHATKRHPSPEPGNQLSKRPKLRRSLSVNDLTSITTRMRPNLATIPANSVLGKSTLGINRGVTKPAVGFGRSATETRNGIGGVRPKPITSKVATSTAGRTVGARPLANGGRTATATSASASGTAASKPLKRIPPYDFKARFHDLQEKHTALRTKHQELQAQLGDLETMPEQYEECQNELYETKQKLENVESELEHAKRLNTLLQAKVNDLTGELETTRTDLTSKLEVKTEEFRVSDEKCKTLAKRNSEMVGEMKEYKEKSEELSEENEKLHTQVVDMKEILFKFNVERKELHNTIMDLRGNIRVFCRVRPPLDSEIDRKSCIWQYNDESSLEICKYTVRTRSWAQHKLTN